MNVFDFDGTIYNGDSSIDFWLFCIRKYPGILRFFPRQFFGGLLFSMKHITKEEFKSCYFSFLKEFSDIDPVVKDFWNMNEHKIKDLYKNLQNEDDCVISASPRFLLEEICRRIGVKNLIATEVDKKTGKLLGKNCHGKNKVAFYQEKFRDVKIESFYSDSLSDKPIAEISRNAFFVKGDKIKIWR